MSFDQPWGFAFALLIPAIVILYLLKLKRIDTPISSVLLWRRSLEDLKANSPFQKLRRNILLFLQLLITAIAVMALAAPILQAIHPDHESVIILIDSSASMGATDVSPSRLEKAKGTVREMIEGLGRNGVMSLITFANEASVAMPMTGDKRRLLSALDSIQIQTTDTRLTDAMGLAYATAREAKNPRIVILSDGAFETNLEDAPEEIPIQLISIGSNPRNVGITELAVRRSFDKDGGRELLVGISAIGDATGEVYLSIYALGDDEEGDHAGHAHESGEENAEESGSHEVSQRRLVDARRVEVQSGRTTSVLLRDEGQYSSKLELALEANDHLAADDRAWIVLPEEKDLDVLLVTDGYYALEKVLPLAPGVRVSKIAPADYTPVADMDVTIFDRFKPVALPPGSYVFLGEVPPLPECSRGEILESPAVVWADRFHPLSRYVNFGALSIARAPAIALPPWADVVVRARETPLIATIERGVLAVVVVGFHPGDTDWPFRVSFPIFFGNILDWFRNRAGSSQNLFHTGEPIPIVSSVAGDLNMVLPNGENRSIPLLADEPAYIHAAGEDGLIHPGLLALNGPGENNHRNVAMNLVSYAESNITPSRSIEIGSVEVESESVDEITTRNLWWPLLLVAFVILIVEWWVYTRRAKYTF